MSFHRIWAVCLRYFYLFARLDQVCELFYFPAIDILLWGMTSIWIQKEDVQIPGIALALLTGLIFWQVFWRGTYETAVNLLQEYWSRNLINMFATPLKVSEWMAATMLVGFGKMLIGLGFGALLVWLLYALNVFSLGWAFLPFTASLMLSGWFVGFLSAGILIYFGQRMQMLAWMIPIAFAPFSAVFYPVDVLPPWIQTISHCLPMTYIFEGMRSILFQKTFSWHLLGISLALNVVYLSLSMVFMKWMFEKTRVKGLARLE